MFIPLWHLISIFVLAIAIAALTPINVIYAKKLYFNKKEEVAENNE